MDIVNFWSTWAHGSTIVCNKPDLIPEPELIQLASKIEEQCNVVVDRGAQMYERLFALLDTVDCLERKSGGRRSRDQFLGWFKSCLTALALAGTVASLVLTFLQLGVAVAAAGIMGIAIAGAALITERMYLLTQS